MSRAPSSWFAEFSKVLDIDIDGIEVKLLLSTTSACMEGIDQIFVQIKEEWLEKGKSFLAQLFDRWVEDKSSRGTVVMNDQSRYLWGMYVCMYGVVVA